MEKRNSRILSLFLALLMLFPITSHASAASATAATMRLSQYTGTVNVTNASGRPLTKWNNMQLYNGYYVETKAKSYAWINLDNTKLVKLDASSKVQIRKSGSKLELLLQSGHIYFNVTSPLTSGETLNVRTSTTVTGIRGTCGWVNVVDQWTTEICVLEGAVQCNVTDPVTGEAKTATVGSGERAVAVAYPQDYEGDKCEFLQEQIVVEDINGFVLEELIQDAGLCGEIYEKSGLDVRDVTEKDVHERLEQDEKELQEKLDDVEAGMAGQDNNVSAGPVWEQGGASPAPGTPGGSTGGDPGPSPSPGPTPTPEPAPTPEPDEMKMPKTAAQVMELLAKYNTVTLIASETSADNKLTVNTGMTIASNQKLILSDGIDVEITQNGYLSIQGEMTGYESLTIESNGDDEIAELEVTGKLTVPSIVNRGTVSNEGTITAEAGITTNGTFGSTGIIQGTVTVMGGSADISGGTVTAATQTGGTVMISHKGTVENGYIFNGSGAATKLTIEDGVIEAGNAGTAALNAGGSGGIFMSGGEIKGGTLSAVSLSGSPTFTIDNGEVASSCSGATVSSAGGGTLTLNGGKITNSGNGWAVTANSGSVTLGEDIDVRAKTATLFKNTDGLAWTPTGYAEILDSADSYYHLRQVTASGTAGDNVTWTLYPDGTFVIQGEGAMENYSAFNIPWSDYSSQIKTVTMGSGVTSIGDSAFYDCSGLTVVTIPDSVTSIGDSAFSGCSALATVYYGGSEEEWGNISIGSGNEDLTGADIRYNSDQGDMLIMFTKKEGDQP